jgi:predicted DCC family thiol-disulfide oxidoreductase YuxK
LTERRFAVIYDGECGICSNLAEQLRRWDRNADLEITASQTPGVKARFPWIAEAEYSDALQVVRIADGATSQGAAAIETLLNVLPKGRLISWLFKFPLMRPASERFYRWFARNRYRMGCGKHCQLRSAGSR